MTASNETPDSFASAWSKANFPHDNRTFVERFINEIGISSYEFVDASYRYIRATRRDKTGSCVSIGGAPPDSPRRKPG